MYTIRIRNLGLYCVFVLLLTLTLLILTIYDEIDDYRSDAYATFDVKQKKIVGTDLKEPVIKANKSILIYSTLFGNTYWPTLDLNEMKTFMGNCEYKHCNITYNKKEISNVDAVLFHGVDVLNEKEYTPIILRQVAKKKRAGQKWVFFIQESPDNYKGFDRYKGLFDWVMSYKYTSDILVPYGHYKELDTWDSPPPSGINYGRQKNNLAIWFVSNCGKPRDEFMQELKRYMPISVGGRCSRELFNQSIDCKRGSQECTQFIKSHKFFFALENTFCEYYVSEKYWQRGIDWGLVPIVMGARYDRLNVIPGSYIDVLAFPSIKKLAEYIKYLGSNDTAYNEYFNWKQKYKRIGYEKMCQLCKALHTITRATKPYRQVWSDHLDCKPFHWKIDQIKRLVEESKSRKI